MGFVKLTDEIIEELRRVRQETGVGTMAFLRSQNDVPRGLNSAIMNSWLRGATKRARRQHLEFVMERWPNITPRIPITRPIREDITRHMKRTGMSYRALIVHMKGDPADLDADMISRWVKGYTKTARKDHLDALLNLLRALPTAEPGKKHVYEKRTPYLKRRVFTEPDRAALESERARTGVQTSELLKYFYKGRVPEGLSAPMINSWINTKPKTVPADFYDWTLSAWGKLPDADK